MFCSISEDVQLHTKRRAEDIIAPNPVFPADDNGNIDPNVASVGVILDEWAFNTLRPGCPG